MGDLRVAESRAEGEQAASFKVAEGAPLVRVSRVIHAENRPVAYLIDLLPEDVLTPAELQVGFTGSVLDLLLRNPAYPLAKSITLVQAVAAGGDVARALEIQRGDVLLLFVGQLHTNEGRVIDLSWSYFLPGYFQFHVVRKVG
jgi:GntR family transcriptional regulator